jgi:hypothetical protein
VNKQVQPVQATWPPASRLKEEPRLLLEQPASKRISFPKITQGSQLIDPFRRRKRIGTFLLTEDLIKFVVALAK